MSIDHFTSSGSAAPDNITTGSAVPSDAPSIAPYAAPSGEQFGLPSRPSSSLKTKPPHQQQQSWLPLVTVTIEFHYHSRSSSSVVSFSTTQQRRAYPFSNNPTVRPASFLHQQLIPVVSITIFLPPSPAVAVLPSLHWEQPVAGVRSHHRPLQIP
ncbi:hypothetical protein H0E87_021534 [Populus deltoides]|uniref:Uncharacterized protein n=1 Tax=Populus deltoides TaxID=3696 RepID=A0A8T2XH33_POPDE|nr:hypothetical protein H0E87_021534 [Populus deltoides]